MQRNNRVGVRFIIPWMRCLCGRPVPITAVFTIALTCALLLLAFKPIPASAHIHAASGKITGQLLNGTKNNTPLVDQTVTLQMAQGNNGQDVGTAKTDAQGHYSFAHLATDKTISYAVFIRYQGAQYVSDLVSLDNQPEQKLNLTVYDATMSTAKVAILQATVLLKQPDAQRSTMSVSELFFFKNLDSHTYVGSLDASKGKPNALRFSLPPDAKNVTLGTGFDGYHIIQVDRGFATDAALPPGDTQFSFSYQIPYTASTYDFSYVAEYPTVQLSVLVSPEIHATASVLSSEGLTNADQHPYRLFKGTQLLANDEVHIGLEGLPTSASASNAVSLNTGVLWLIVGAILAVAIVIVLWFLYRSRSNRRKVATRRRGSISATATKKTATKEKGATPVSVPEPSIPKSHKDALLQKMLELDKAFEAGKLSQSEYQTQRAKIKARLRVLISEQEGVSR